MSCGSCKNVRFGGMYRLHNQGGKNKLGRNNVFSNWQVEHAADSFHPDDGGVTFLCNVVSDESHDFT
jgi:hypothetical protein